MRLFTLILGILIVQVTLAQSISVENFQHHKHYFWQINSQLPLDKNNASVLLKSKIKGLKFSTSKESPIEVEEDEEGFLLKVPDKTKYIIISHPELGVYTWRVPVKFLKKHNYYSVDLYATDLTKEFKNPNQWVVFNISPENAILTIDSVVNRINDGNISLYLPVGKHSFTIESPFYESISDSITLIDSEKIERNIFLQPLYSYLTVAAEDESVEIFVDEERRGTGNITIGRITDGHHRLSLLKNNKWINDTIIYVGRAEKKTITFRDNHTNGNFKMLTEKFEKNPKPNIYRELSIVKNNPEKMLSELRNRGDNTIMALVKLTAEDTLSLILIDREPVGYGEWSGLLSEGFHLITTEKDGKESAVKHLTIVDNQPIELQLNAPTSGEGLVNLQTNVTGAEVLIKDKIIDQTPCVITGLKPGETYTLTIRKDGYQTKKVEVLPKGNQVIQVDVTLKKD
ncbi:MAG: PEGA domain-containing protein [Muribaculaceae bacterium]|nr:PEGA domain-containing protein [Muribaculaceae bacterium]